MKRIKVLMSAYACEPGKGSEPGVGWNVAREMAEHHDIWVITRANNRSVIEAELENNPVDSLHFVYFDLPKWIRWWKKGGLGVQLYYYLWQLCIYPLIKKLHRSIDFDLAHHITFVRYWMPSLLSFLPIPFLWGPVGGGESAPKAFWKDISLRGKSYEMMRDLARWLGEHDPLVRITALRSRLVLVTTDDTAGRIRVLGMDRTEVLSQVGITNDEVEQLSCLYCEEESVVRFVSVGNLLHWKGFHLGLLALAQSGLTNAQYWIIGHGPERVRLEGIAQSLGVEGRVQFWSKLSRRETLEKLGQSSVLLHPSLHDSGGFVCLEAMAAGKPVICLDLGGPAVQVTEETGFKIPAHNPEQAVRDMAEAMKRLAENKTLRQNMGEAGRNRVQNVFSWAEKSRRFNQLYEKIAF